MGLTIKELIPIGERILQGGGIDDYKIDAELLLSFETGYDKNKIFMNWTAVIEHKHCERYFDLVNLRATGMPLQYITGEQHFMGRRFSVNESVLIPRPETETLVSEVIAYIKQNSSVKNVLDLCTGSGIIAITLAKTFPQVKVLGTDISEEALKVARQNAKSIAADNSPVFASSDMFSSIRSGRLGKKFDLIVSNPPYIRSDDISGLQREVRDHEPVSALDGGADGLDFYRSIAAEAKPYFKKKAALFLEIGENQAEDVTAILASESIYKDISVLKDLTGRDRIIKADVDKI